VRPNESVHGRATEEGRRTGFPLLRYGCQLRASVLEHSSIWRNLKCIDIERAKHLVFVYDVVPGVQTAKKSQQLIFRVPEMFSKKSVILVI
jgi:hypothetical protein